MKKTSSIISILIVLYAVIIIAENKQDQTDRKSLTSVNVTSGDCPQNVLDVITEATRKNNDPIGRPLPLASSWDCGQGSWGLTGYPKYAPRPPKEGQLNLQKQQELLLAGHHWLPITIFPFQKETRAEDWENGSAWFNHTGFFEPWDTFAKWGIPITMAATQFDAPIYNQSNMIDRWVKLPPSKNPNIIRNGVHLMGKLGPKAISTTAGSKTVKVTLPDTTGLLEDSRIWISQDIEVGGLQMNDERWDIDKIEGNVVTFSHKEAATSTETGGNVTYEAAYIISVADPMGPTKPWYEVGEWWMSGFRSSGWKDLQKRYSDPPLIIFLSNNEGRLMGVKQRHESKRYVDAYGEDTKQSLGAKIRKTGFSERFKHLFKGMRENMPKKWADVSVMVAYNEVFIWPYGRWGGWRENVYGDDLNYQKDILAWDGASPEYYLNDWQSCSDAKVFSPQTEFMNTKWQLDLVYKTDPDFWYEMSVWDGFPKKREWFKSQSDPFTPERYKAWIQYGMWLTRPRVVREFRNTGCTLETTGEEYFNKFLEAVDDVYADPVKTRFWRKGTVVANTTMKHPYRIATLEKYDSIPKWFNLTTNLDKFPPAGQSIGLDTEVPVWALALVIGEAPEREWLVYAYSPKGDRKDVVITIPDYKDITLDVPQAGVFHHVVE